MSIANQVRSGISTIGNINERLDRDLSEYGLILLFLISALYMLNGSSEFGSQAAQFPRLTSGVVVVGTVLLLLKNVLPGPIRTFVEESNSALGPATEEELTEMTEEELKQQREEEANGDAEPAGADGEATAQLAETADEETTLSVGEEPAEQSAVVEDDSYRALVSPDILILLTPLFMLGYIVLSLLIGALWASPIFVVLYLLLTGQRWYTNVTLMILAFIIPYGFMTILNFDLHTGILIPEGLGILEQLGLL